MVVICDKPERQAAKNLLYFWEMKKPSAIQLFEYKERRASKIRDSSQNYTALEWSGACFWLIHAFTGLLGVVASMDECGAIALWHALEKTSTSWNADASTETAQNVNVVLIRIRQLESWNKSKVVPAHLYNNTANGGTLLVTTVQGHIIAPNQQTTEYKTVRYGKGTLLSCCHTLSCKLGWVIGGSSDQLLMPKMLASHVQET